MFSRASLVATVKLVVWYGVGFAIGLAVRKAVVA